METTSFENDATFERIQLHIEQLGKALDALDWSDEPSSGAQIGEHLQGLREAMESAALKLLETQEHSRALVVAQADALVRSAEIIDELEETKRQLAESRQLAEEAARDNQTLADTVLQGVNDPILLLKDGLCVACNRRVEEFFGVTADACLETCPIDILAPSESGTGESTPVERGARETIYERALREGLYQFETVLTRLGNVETWCEITMNRFPFKQEDHVLVVVRDISERKTFEEELLRNRDFLLNIINAVPDQIFVKSADRRIVLVNDAFCQAHDVLRDQVTGETADFLFAPEVAPEIDRVESRVIGAGQVETMEVECRPDGQEPRILSVKKSRYRDPVSDERMIVTTSRDVTDERAKSARMRLLASVFTNATEGVAILDPDGIVCEANPTFRRMLRRRNQSVEQSRLDELMEWRGQQFDGILGDVRAGRAWAGQMKFTPDQGGEHMFRVSFGPLPDEHGQVHKIIALFSDISELHKSRELLRKQVLHDSLTGLPNRRYFRDRVAEAVRRSSTQGKRFAIAFLDLDDFKDVNDTLGHNIGDELLRIVARRIRSTLRDDCFVARFGGDEFAVLIPDIDAGRQRVRNIAARISRVLQEPFRIGDAEAFVGVSIGTTVYPDHTSDPDELLRNADVAMYAAKSAGKNHARLFDYAMHNAVESRHRLQIALRNALDNGELTLFYQPKVTADTLEPRGCEALVRWFSENGRFVSPGEFIPIAEETGLIARLGNDVLHQACQQALHWHGQGRLDSRIAVNISPRQLRDPLFVRNVERVIGEANARPEWFEIEITENTVMDDVDLAMRLMQQLSEMGFSLALDDFGTGYSSLSMLRAFRLDTLKIDSSFVRHLPDDSSAVAVARSIISLGKGLGLSIVAEGVETARQLEFLNEEGCDLIQGYYICRPVKPDDYDAWSDSWLEKS